MIIQKCKDLGQMDTSLRVVVHPDKITDYLVKENWSKEDMTSHSWFTDKMDADEYCYGPNTDGQCLNSKCVGIQIDYGLVIAYTDEKSELDATKYRFTITQGGFQLQDPNDKAIQASLE